MPGPYQLTSGEHLAKLARQAGFQNWLAVWEDGSNAALRQKRDRPLVLFHGDQSTAGAQGDIVNIPSPEQKQSGGQTDSHHPHNTGRNKLFLRLRVLDERHKPLALAKYRLIVDGVVVRKSVDVTLPDGEEWFDSSADGSLDCEISVTAESGRLDVLVRPQNERQDQTDVRAAAVPQLGQAGTGQVQRPQSPPKPVQYTFHLQIGKLNPIEEEAPDKWCLSGVQARLNNLGFGAGPVNGLYTTETYFALRRFQSRLNIQESPSEVQEFEQYVQQNRPLGSTTAPTNPLPSSSPVVGGNSGTNAAPQRGGWVRITRPGQTTAATTGPVQQPPPLPPRPPKPTPGANTQTALYQYHDHGEDMPPPTT